MKNWFSHNKINDTDSAKGFDNCNSVWYHFESICKIILNLDNTDRLHSQLASILQKFETRDKTKNPKKVFQHYYNSKKYEEIFQERNKKNIAEYCYKIKKIHIMLSS